MDKELDSLLSTREITVADNKIIVKRFSFIDTLKLATKTSGLVTKIMNNAEIASSAISKIQLETDDQTATSIKVIGALELLTLLEDDSAEFVKTCIGYATNLTDDEIENLDPDIGVELLITIYEVNKGFFTKCMTKLKKVMSLPKETKKKTKTK